MLTTYSRLLVQHPHVLVKLRREINDALGVGPEATIPDISRIRTLPYLSIVLKEGIGKSAYPSPHKVLSLMSTNSSSPLPIRAG